MMFQYVENKEKYISFSDDNYLDSYGNGTEVYTDEEKVLVIASIPSDHWYTFDKVKVFTNGSVEVIGAFFYNPKFRNVTKYVGEYTDGSGTIEFNSKAGDPLLQWEGVITRPNGDKDIISYESSRYLRESWAGLTTGTNFNMFGRCPHINEWLARSYIEGKEHELFFLVENKQMLIDVANYYDLPVPYDTDLETQMDNDLQSIRLKSIDLNNEGPGNFVAVVIAAIVFENDIPIKLRLYKTSRWNG